MRWLADVVYAVAALLYLPFALYNAFVLGKNRTGWGERFGRLPNFETASRRIWVHAVSLGEVNATPLLIKLLLEQLPGTRVVISSTTDTGYARAVQLYGPARVFRFPLDFSWVIHRAIAAIQPAMIVLVELEVWPNLISEAARRGIPVVVVNGRLTQRSARRFGRLGQPIRKVFQNLNWVGAQDETIGARFRSLGVAPLRLEITGSVKWDTAIVADRVEGDRELQQQMGLDRSRPILVCGSTGPSEEAMLLDAYDSIIKKRGLENAPRLVLIPRKPERFDEVASLIASRGFSCVRRSAHTGNSSPATLAADSVILGDTMGELRVFYSLADLVFIGRSLVPMGGSDPMEAAGLGKPILSGPYTQNFEEPVRALREAGALVVVESPAALAAEIERGLADPEGLKRRGLRGRDIVTANQGATRKTVQRLVLVLGESQPAAAPFQQVDSSLSSSVEGLHGAPVRSVQEHT